MNAALTDHFMLMRPSTSLAVMWISLRYERPLRLRCLLILPLLMLCATWVQAPACALAQGEPQFWDNTVSEWIEIAQFDEDAEQRSKAAFAFGLLGPKAAGAVPTLIAMLEDSDVQVREEAAMALGRVRRGGPTVIAALVKALDDESSYVAEAAAGSLGDFGPDARDAIDGLIGILDRDIDSTVPIEALCRLGESAFEPLVDILMDNQRSESLRQSIATALVHFGERAVEPLALLAQAGSPPIRSQAIYALGDIGPVTEHVVPTLVEALQASDSHVRRSAAYSIEKCGPEAKAAIATLIVALRDADRDVGKNAADALAAMEAELEPFVPQLIECLRDNESFVRHHAAKAISTIGPRAESAVPVLVEMLEEHPESEVHAITTLGLIGPAASSALPAILERLEQHPLVVTTAIARMESTPPDLVKRLVKLTASKDPLTRAGAIDALGELGKGATPALPTLLSHLEDSGSYEVERWNSPFMSRDMKRVTVAESVPGALEKIGPAAIPGLVDALSHDNKSVRRFAIAALGRIDGPRKDAARPLREALSDDDGDYRAAAARTLASIGADATDAADALVQMFLTDAERNNRIYAARALGRLGEGTFVSVLAEGTRHPDQEVRASAIQALGRLGPAAVLGVPALVVALEDDGHRMQWISAHSSTIAPIRLDAVEALGQVGPGASEAVAPLTAMLNDENCTSQVAVALALWRIDRKNDVSIPALLAALTDGDEKTRQSAAYALRALGSSAEPALPTLIDAIDDPSWIVRKVAAEALGEIGPAAAEATPHLIELLLDNEDEFFKDYVRHSAAGALGKLGRGAVPHLITALDHPRLPIRVAAAEALGQIGAPAWAAIPHLEAAHEDEYFTFRYAAADALHNIRKALPSP